MRAHGRLRRPGATLYWECVGAGPPVILVHGFALDRRMWDDIVPELATTRRVIRYDCRGFGASSAPDPDVPYTHADDLLALLEHLELDRVAIIGLSFGGGVALMTALRAPKKLSCLVLIDAVLDGVPWDEVSAAASDLVERRARESGVAAGRQAWLRHPLFAPARERADLAVRLTAMVETYPGHHWLGTDPHEPLDPPPITALDRVEPPTTVIVGDRDVPCFLQMAQKLAECIPGARLVLIPGAGHMTPMEAPALVLLAVRQALAENE